MSHKAFCETEIIFAKKEEMVNKILSFSKSNILLIMSESSVSRWKLYEFIEDIKSACYLNNKKFVWIREVPQNPTQMDIVKTLKYIGNNKIDLIIAVGGGSSIDLAKVVSVFCDSKRNSNYTNEEISLKIKKQEYGKDKFVNIIAIPTTAGTGSEVTSWATVWDADKQCKYSVEHYNIKPKMAIIVPELTKSMSSIMTLSTGLDAICQAIEAYWSKNTNPIVQEIAYRSIQLLVNNLKEVIDNPNNVLLREKICRASVLAGIAFSKTKTTACHSISYPLTFLYEVPHGLAVALTLDEVANINKGNFKNDVELFDLFKEFGSIKKWVDFVSEGIVNMRLSYFGISRQDIPIIVNKSFTTGRMNNNPINLSKKDVGELLLRIL